MVIPYMPMLITPLGWTRRRLQVQVLKKRNQLLAALNLMGEERGPFKYQTHCVCKWKSRSSCTNSLRVLEIIRIDAERDPATNPNAIYAKVLIDQVTVTRGSENWRGTHQPSSLDNMKLGFQVQTFHPSSALRLRRFHRQPQVTSIVLPPSIFQPRIDTDKKREEEM